VNYVARCRVLTDGGDYFLTHSDMPVELFDEHRELALKALADAMEWHLTQRGLTAVEPAEYLIVAPGADGSEVERGIL
jgi:hypothetical protein